jgi:YD repeat-containing protein
VTSHWTNPAWEPVAVTYGYDAAGDLVDVFDVEGGNWHFTYDAQHRLRTRRFPRQSARPPGDQKVIEHFYDSEGRSYREVDEEGNETLLSWDVDGEVTTTTVTETRAGVGHETRYRYEYRFLVEETRGLGSADETTTTYRSDPATGGMTWIRDGNGNVTTQDFDEHGNLRYRRDPAGRTSYWDYNGFNEPVFVVAPDGHRTQHTYDTAGNLTRIDVEYRADVLGTPVERTISTVYGRDDPAHPDDVTSVVDGEGKVWFYGYDQYGYRTSVTSPVGDTTSQAFDRRYDLNLWIGHPLEGATYLLR